MIGDDIYLQEDTLSMIIGRQAATIEILSQRISAKDKALKQNDQEIQDLKDKLGKTKKSD